MIELYIYVNDIIGVDSMKYSLIEIREYGLKLAEVISEVLRVDVEIVDCDFIRIAGTGRYKNKACVSIEGQNNVYLKVIETGKKQVVENPGFHKLCSDCDKRNSCIEKFEYCTPILVDEEVIGVIALVCFTEEQKKIIIEKFKEYFDFLDKMSELISTKAKENYFDYLKTNKNYITNNDDSQKGSSFGAIVGHNNNIQKIKIESKKVAKGNAAVLIYGESGTGKELFARAIHNESRRSNGPFIAINCGAIPDNLLESELFGYATGAFTGANRNGKIGKFELANKGTIFLDEVCDMPLHFQVKLLRVLQEKVVIPVGSNKIKPIDVRIISATNKDIDEMLKSGQFREDLYYRLNVIPIEIPPLRERKDDIPMLVNFFLKKYSSIYKMSVPKVGNEAMQALIDYRWKGNIRELENAVEYIITLLQDDEMITIEHLPKKILESNSKETRFSIGEDFNLENIEKKAIIDALKSYEQNTEGKRKVADVLGISLSTLYRKVEKYKITVEINN